jgi:hypothetical protein
VTLRATLWDARYHQLGWLTVDPADYAYDGPDPTGNITALLDRHAAGDIDWRVDPEIQYADGATTVAPDERLARLASRVGTYESITFVEFPDDFENP